jgi:hypothetical protein
MWRTRTWAGLAPEDAFKILTANTIANERRMRKNSVVDIYYLLVLARGPIDAQTGQRLRGDP